MYVRLVALRPTQVFLPWLFKDYDKITVLSSSKH